MSLRKLFNIFLVIVISVTALGYDAEVQAASSSAESSVSAQAAKRKKSYDSYNKYITYPVTFRQKRITFTETP